jgi:hypothetical protein
MGAARDRSDALAAIAGIRGLQSRAGEIQALRAVDAHRAAKERHENWVETLAETQAGWAKAVAGGSFDPGMARHWFSALEQGHAEERRLEAQVASAGERLERDRAAWQAAAARSDAADEQAQAAAKRAASQREEARLAALEDRAAARTIRR